MTITEQQAEFRAGAATEQPSVAANQRETQHGTTDREESRTIERTHAVGETQQSTERSEQTGQTSDQQDHGEQPGEVTAPQRDAVDSERAETARERSPETDVRQADQSDHVVPQEDAPDRVQVLPTEKLKVGAIARDAVMNQLAVLEKYKTGLFVFDKVINSETNSAAKADMQKVLFSYIKEKGMQELIFPLAKAVEIVPGLEEVVKIAGKIDQEIERASVASDSVTQRDFFVEHISSVGTLQAQLLEQVEEIGGAVEWMEQEVVRTGKGGEQFGDTLVQFETLREAQQDRFRSMTPQSVFTELTQQWIRTSTTDLPGHRGKVPSHILVSINKESTVRGALFETNREPSIREARIKAPYGDRIAEQVNRYAPNGVNVFNINVPLRIVIYEHTDDRYPSGLLVLDERGRVGEDSYGYSSILDKLNNGQLPSATPLK